MGLAQAVVLQPTDDRDIPSSWDSIFEELDEIDVMLALAPRETPERQDFIKAEVSDRLAAVDAALTAEAAVMAGMERKIRELEDAEPWS